jgi:hypothetical protein
LFYSAFVSQAVKWWQLADLVADDLMCYWQWTRRQGTGLFFEFIVVFFLNHPSSIAPFRSAIAPDRAAHYQIGDPLAVGLISNLELGWSHRKKVKFVVFGCTLAMYTCPIVLNILPLKCLYNYRGSDKSLARPTSRCTLFDGENISFDASLVIYINSTNIPPSMIINRISVVLISP